MVVACGDDDSAEPEPEDSFDYGEWVCYDYGNECFCHTSKGEESPSAETRIVDKCDWLSCCVSYQDDYSLRCDCRGIRRENCQLETEGKTNASVVEVCPP
jgi:hypothetical protein